MFYDCILISSLENLYIYTILCSLSSIRLFLLSFYIHEKWQKIYFFKIHIVSIGNSIAVRNRSTIWSFLVCQTDTKGMNKMRNITCVRVKDNSCHHFGIRIFCIVVKFTTSKKKFFETLTSDSNSASENKLLVIFSKMSFYTRPMKSMQALLIFTATNEHFVAFSA